MSQALPAVVTLNNDSDSLFYVVLTITHLEKHVKCKIEGVRICGTFDSFPAVKALAHRCLLDQGYE